MRDCMIVIWWSRTETQDFREQELKYYKKIALILVCFYLYCEIQYIYRKMYETNICYVNKYKCGGHCVTITEVKK